jgi:hypothetical protein
MCTFQIKLLHCNTCKSRFNSFSLTATISKFNVDYWHEGCLRICQLLYFVSTRCMKGRHDACVGLGVGLTAVT